MRVRVKFCGITSKEDAEKGISLGADGLGFVFFKDSPRYVNEEDASAIIKAMPPFVSSVGVFVNEDLGFVEECALRCGLSAVQLHGDEDEDYCSQFRGLKLSGVKLIKAIRVKDKGSLSAMADCMADAYLLDAFRGDMYGGTGAGFDLTIAAMAKEFTPNIIISGGLTPRNVAGVIKRINPFGVDVSSGIETSPGRKDAELMRQFIKEVRRLEAE